MKKTIQNEFQLNINDSLHHWMDCAKHNEPAYKNGDCNCIRITKDGDQWCVLMGDNLQDGICSFAKTIDLAVYKFVKENIDEIYRRVKQPLIENK